MGTMTSEDMSVKRTHDLEGTVAEVLNPPIASTVDQNGSKTESSNVRLGQEASVMSHEEQKENTLANSPRWCNGL